MDRINCEFSELIVQLRLTLTTHCEAVQRVATFETPRTSWQQRKIGKGKSARERERERER
jgi:hypothetical protein